MIAMTPRPMTDGQTSAACALVTGASRGIGAAIATSLSEAGWPIAVNFRADRSGADGVVDAIRSSSGVARAFQADVADEDAVERMFDEVESELGPPLVVVNNAGVRDDQLVVGLAGESWRRVVDVNLSGTYNVCHHALRPMIRARFGRIVNVSTISATTPLPGQAAYAASKAGIEALTRVIAVEVARRGVTCNAIAPGLVDTDFVPEMSDEWARGVPARRFAAPEEIATLVRFLASDEAAYVNGSVIRIDGGLTAGIPVIGRPSRTVAAA